MDAPLKTMFSHLGSLPPRVIGIAGQKGHGKNLLATMIGLHDSSFVQAAFANPLKDLVAEVFSLSREGLEDQTYKEAKLPEAVYIDDFLSAIEAATGLQLSTHGLSAFSPRELLQLVGTEYVRAASPNYWPEKAMELVRRDGNDTLFTDVRFPNEAAAVRKAGGLVVRVVRDGKILRAAHSSEKIKFPIDATFTIASGDLNRVRDVALGVLAMINAPREFAVRLS